MKNEAIKHLSKHNPWAKTQQRLKLIAKETMKRDINITLIGR
jgi:hypothetical protein